MDSRDRGCALGHRKTIWIKRNPKEHPAFLGVSFCLCGYKRERRVTVTDLRLQNLECGYNTLAATVAPPKIVSISEPFSKFAVLTAGKAAK